MTALPHPNPALREVAYHWAELLSDANPVRHGVVQMGDGSMVAYSPPGSVRPHARVLHAPITVARSEGSAATSNQRNWGSMGAANEPSLHDRAGV
jgi:hypothetical protein